VNGWEEHYQEKSFLFQCKERFGADVGEEVWEECNQSFDRLPLAGVIDHEIFCIHGGFPRPVPSHHKTEIQAILAIPHLVAIMPAYDHELDWMKQVATDCIWSDPASEDMESIVDEESGFGESPRGGGAVCFGSRAIDNFLENNQLSYIIRAHEAHAHGVALSKGARVFTVFSTSKDHRQGMKAMAGCILVDNDKIQVINRSHKYKNKYVHRRTSVSMEHLSPEEMDERQRLGLVRDSVGAPMPPPVKYEEDAGVDADGNEVYFTSGVSYTPGF
jgi:diadenosine tetraphosphatase ApaH/serine/threonine PP2A family protein phosphatase